MRRLADVGVSGCAGADGPPLLKVWSDEGCEHRGNLTRRLPELEDLRRGGIADAVLACAQRPDKGFAIVGLYIACIPGAAAGFITSRRARQLLEDGAPRRRLASDGRGALGASRPSNIWIASASRRGRTGSTAGRYVDAVVAARQGRVVRGALKRGSIVLPFCDGCGRRVAAARRCARCKHVFYCSVECQKAAWARPVAGHARTCAALGISRSGPGP